MTWVVGLGAMGSALAALLARSEFRVIGIEQDSAGLLRGRGLVQRHVRDAAEMLELGRAEVDRILGNVDYTIGMEAALPPDLVIEALPERFELKCETLRRADAMCGAETVFVSTTTGLSVAELAARSGRMTRTVGLHLCNPWSAATAGALELVRTPVTDEAVLAAIGTLVHELGKTPVPVTDHPGFVGGALLMAYLNRAAQLYDEGYAARDDIDAAMTLGCGLPLGPLEQLDQVGLDVAHDTLEALHRRCGDQAYRPAPILGRMVRAGLLGRKSARGFYRYDPGADGEPAWSGPDRPAGEDVLPVRSVGLVGAGIMAAGIAEVCARAGFPTTLVARTDVRAKEARSSVERSLNRAVRRGKLTGAELDSTMARLVTTAQPTELRDCDVVIEAVSEDRTVKQEVFAKLDKVVRPGAILASTTSSLSVLDCALATDRPRCVVGMHFFNPAPAMKLVEVARTCLTAPEVVDAMHAFGAALGKRTVDCTDRTGFIVNYLLFPYLNQAVEMLRTRHVRPDDIDLVMTQECGYPLGPLQLLDLIGLDVGLAIQSSLRDALGDAALAPARYLTDLAAAGHLGRKTGQGFHLYKTDR